MIDLDDLHGDAITAIDDDDSSWRNEIKDYQISHCVPLLVPVLFFHAL